MSKNTELPIAKIKPLNTIDVSNLRLKMFVDAVNEDIKELNDYIQRYNDKNTPENLHLIFRFYEKLNNQYPLSLMSQCEEYQIQIHQSLRDSLRLHCRALNIKEWQSFTASETKLITTPGINVLSEIIANMPYEKLQQITAILWENNSINERLGSLYAKSEEGFDEWNRFLQTHSLTVLSGTGNSRNLQIANFPPDDYPPFLLKIDSRLGGTRQDKTLRESGVEYLTRCYDPRRYVTLKGSSIPVTYEVLVMDCCSKGNLVTHAQKRSKHVVSYGEEMVHTIQLFQEMAAILSDMQSRNVVFTDSKNQNWLLNEDVRLRISDTKSFLMISDGIFYRTENENTWTDVYVSAHCIPPEHSKKPNYFDASELHAYILGKNIYEYLINLSPDIEKNQLYTIERGLKYKKEFSENDFKYAIFQVAGGRELKILIQKLVVEKKSDRMKLEAAFSQLNALLARREDIINQYNDESALRERTLRPLVNECKSLYAQIAIYSPGNPDEFMFNLQWKKIPLDASAKELELIKDMLSKELEKKQNTPTDTIIELKSNISKILTNNSLDLKDKLRYLTDLESKKQLQLYIRAIWKENKGDLSFSLFSKSESELSYREIQKIFQNKTVKDEDRVSLIVLEIQKLISKHSALEKKGMFIEVLSKVFMTINEQSNHQRKQEPPVGAVQL